MGHTHTGDVHASPPTHQSLYWWGPSYVGLLLNLNFHHDQAVETLPQAVMWCRPYMAMTLPWNPSSPTNKSPTAVGCTINDHTSTSTYQSKNKRRASDLAEAPTKINNPKRWEHFKWYVMEALEGHESAMALAPFPHTNKSPTTVGVT